MRKSPKFSPEVAERADATTAEQSISCDACRQPTPAHDVVNYGSTEGGYRQLCGRCFNETAASRLGLQGFDHVDFEPVRMVDARGAAHDFQFRTRLFGPAVAIDAFELREGSPAGYAFQVRQRRHVHDRHARHARFRDGIKQFAHAGRTVLRFLHRQNRQIMLIWLGHEDRDQYFAIVNDVTARDVRAQFGWL